MYYWLKKDGQFFWRCLYNELVKLSFGMPLRMGVHHLYFRGGLTSQRFIQEIVGPHVLS